MVGVMAVVEVDARRRLGGDDIHLMWVTAYLLVDVPIQREDDTMMLPMRFPGRREWSLLWQA